MKAKNTKAARTSPKAIEPKKSVFIKSFKEAKSKPSKSGLIILFDILFVISIFALNRLAQYFAPLVIGAVLAPTLATGILYIVFSLIYYLIALFAYSFFKYSVLDCIKSVADITEKGQEFSFGRLGQFYALNIVIAGIFFAVMLAANLLLAAIQQPYVAYIFIIIAIPYLLFLYVIMNTSHSLFYQGASIKESLKKGFSITFTKMQVYRETILIMIILALVLWVLFLGSGYLVRFVGSKNYALYLNLYSYFKQASIIAFDLVLYAAIFINRISFYSLIKQRT